MMTRALLTLLFATISPSLLLAATPLRDINATPAGDATFAYLSPVDLSSATLFVFNDGTHGTELWATDGTPGGTRLVLDINPGPASSSIRYLTVVNGVAFFWADDGTNGPELWKSDGTPAGTSIVANIIPDDRVVDGDIEPPIVAMGGRVYFVANDGQSGAELWRSDGTAAGTYRLKDIAPGAASSDPDMLTVVGSTLFFVANDGTTGRELWASDGTPEGTRLTKDIAPGSNYGISSPVMSGSTLYFIATSASTGTEVWRIAEKGSAPELVQDVVPGATGAAATDPRGLLRAHDGIVFAEADALFYAGPTGGAVLLGSLPCPTGTPETFMPVVMPTHTLFAIDCDAGQYSNVWTTDGTAAGTGPLDPARGVRFLSGGSASVVAATGEAYFVAQQTAPNSSTPVTSLMLWRSDGTPSGTHPITDTTGNTGNESVAQLGGRVYFVYGASSDATAGGELWSTDGTPQGTARVADIQPGPASSQVSELTYAGGKLLFKAYDGAGGVEPWMTDGTLAGTLRLHAPAAISTQGSRPTGYFPFAGGALFTADDGVNGNELWFTDGTPDGTRLVADTAPGATPSNASGFVSLGSQVLFENMHDLWRTDGTTAGTFRIASGGDPIESSYGGASVLNGVAYFGASDATNGVQLWRSDGTSAGTYLFKVVGAGIHPMAVIGGRLLFASGVGSDPEERLWVTDGTVAGTVPLRMDLELGNFLDSVVFKGFLYFEGVDASGDRELWRSDGTVAGTTRVQDLRAGDSSLPNLFFANDSVLTFVACTGGPSCAVFASHDPAAGVEQLGSFQRNGPVVTDGTRLFWIDGSTTPGRLVISDGTLAGTAYLQGTLPFKGEIRQYVWFSGQLVMTVDDATFGTSLWATDGTAAGTHLVADINPSTAVGDELADFFVMGSKLLLTAAHPSLGVEPWVLDASPNADNDSVRTKFNSTARIDVLANDGDLTGRIDRSSTEIVAEPALGTASVDAGTGEIVYTPTTGHFGADSLQYVVKNQAGRVSNVATVNIIIAQSSGPGAGTAPVPPPVTTPPATTPPATSSSGGSGSGGGGGAIDAMTLLALGLLALGEALQCVRARRRITVCTARAPA
jgi:ELWxxDGT repeat protein